MNRRFFAVLFAFAAVTLAIPFATRADSYKNYSRAGAATLGARPANGAQLGFWDPAVSGSLDTGYIDTAGCRAGCLSANVEVETATTTASCQTYGSYDSGGFASVVTNAKVIGAAVTVSASGNSWNNSICPGAAGTNAANQWGLPKYVRVYCAAAAGVNMRAFMSCH